MITDCTDSEINLQIPLNKEFSYLQKYVLLKDILLVLFSHYKVQRKQVLFCSGQGNYVFCNVFKL